MEDQERDEILIRLDERTKKVDESINRIEDRVSATEDKLEKHDNRIQSNEDDLSKAKWVIGAIVTTLSGATAKLMNLI